MYLVSVIIPAYNSERYVVEAVQSVFTQTCKDYEVIIIDDGSSDQTVERIRPYAMLSNFSIIEQANSGPSKARNRGIKAARGKYCAFLDSDDIMMPERLALQVTKMEEKPEVGMVYCDLMTFNDRGMVHSTKKIFIKPYSGAVLEKLVLDNFITTSTVMARKECFEKVGFFDETIRHSEDYKMWLNIAKEYEIEYLDIPLVKYRYQSDGLSSNKVAMTTSSFNIINDFWEGNREYKRKHNILYRMSIAHQLTNMGNAYYYFEKYSRSAKFLIESLITYPFFKETYKTIMRLMLKSFRKKLLE